MANESKRWAGGPLGEVLVTTVATAIVSPASDVLVKDSVVIGAMSTNTVSVFIGDSTVTPANGLELQPGAYISLPIKDPASVYVVSLANSGAKVRSLAVLGVSR